MTVSTIACWRKKLRRTLGVAVWCLWTGIALAGTIEPKSATLVAEEGGGQALNAEFAINLGNRLEDAVARGVVLHFRLEFTLTRKRWYWADEHVAGRLVEYKLGYQALTRQYRLSSGNHSQQFDSLEDALRVLGRVARLHVLDRIEMVPGDTYRAAVRLSLDRNQLPKPLQVDAIADREWRIDSRTLSWDLLPATAK